MIGWIACAGGTAAQVLRRRRRCGSTMRSAGRPRPRSGGGMTGHRRSRQMSTYRVIALHPDDGVVIARTTLMPGAPVADGIATSARIPAGHKVAVRPHGWASRCGATTRSSASPHADIEPGQHVHVHNLGMGEFAKDYAFGQDAKPTDYDRSPGDVRGHSPPGRPRRDAQLHRHPDLGELQRPCGEPGRRRVQAPSLHGVRAPRRLSRTWTASSR